MIDINLKNAILDLLASSAYIPMSPTEMYEYLSKDLPDLAEEDFWRALFYLRDEEFSVAFTKKNKLVLSSALGYYKGIFSASPKGNFGFVITDDGEYFIPPTLTFCAISGDTVVCKKFERSSKYYSKGNEAEVVAVIERGVREIIGTIASFNTLKGNNERLLPDNTRIKYPIKIEKKHLNGAAAGQKVLCEIIYYPKSESDLIKCKVKEILGKSDSKEANYKAVLYENGITTVFPDKVLEEAEIVSKEEITTRGRLDLRDKTIFTIDSSEAKDLDDAISIETTDTGYILGVHIADVSHYVKQDSPLDKEALKRGTSVYFTDKVVPMLPKELSNGICSLNEGEDRYTLSALIHLDKDGNILFCELKKSVINSKIKGIYAELNDILERGEESEFYGKYAHVIEDFKKMYQLYGILKAKSESKGAMELESEETEILLDDDGHPIEIVKRERGETERLIEQFMLCANEAVATYLYNSGLPCVFRVHDEPDMEKINAFSLFARNLGIDVSPLRTKHTIKPSQLSRVLEDAREKGHLAIVSSVLLRSLMKAKYSSLQKPHFGLSTELYCHFTSPIRRYPDLTVHRIINALLNGEINEKTVELYERLANTSALMSSENEVKAIHAERDIDDLYKCIYMNDRIGQTYDAVISSVTAFGFFAKTENLCEGLVPIESLGNGFHFDKDNFTLSRGKTAYRLGQSVKIQVYDVDISARAITFSLIKERGTSSDISSDTDIVTFDGGYERAHSRKDSVKGTGKDERRGKGRSHSGSKGKGHKSRSKGYTNKKTRGRRKR
ncbi:MAG: ribonuclease R [Clostridia bacterium]|nr:ribonuclease R [Clostridia bacterium]